MLVSFIFYNSMISEIIVSPLIQIVTLESDTLNPQSDLRNIWPNHRIEGFLGHAEVARGIAHTKNFRNHCSTIK